MKTSSAKITDLKTLKLTLFTNLSTTSLPSPTVVRNSFDNINVKLDAYQVMSCHTALGYEAGKIMKGIGY